MVFSKKIFYFNHCHYIDYTAIYFFIYHYYVNYENYTFRQIGGYSHGTFKKVTEEQIQAISTHDNVKAVGVRTVIGFIQNGAFAKCPAEVSYMDENCAQWCFSKPTTGRLPQNKDEIALDTKALELLGITPAIGEKISLTYMVEDKEKNKSDLSYDKTDTFTLVGWWDFDEICPVHFINISKKYTQSIETEKLAKGMNPLYHDLNVMMASSLDIKKQMEQVDLDLGYTWDKTEDKNNVPFGVNWGYTSTQISEKIDITTIIPIIAFLSLIIFTGYLIIYNIFQISVIEDIKLYGLLKTIGATSKQLRRIIRLQALFLCVLSSPIGLTLGYAIATSLIPLIMAQTNIGSDFSIVSTSPFIFLFSLAFILITVLLSCYRPSKTASKISPIEAIKFTEKVKTGKKYRTIRGARVYQMAFSNLGKNKSKTCLVIISLALSVVLLNALFAFSKGFDMEKYLAKATCADFIVSTTDYFNFRPSLKGHLTRDQVHQLESNLPHSLSGCAYKTTTRNTLSWISRKTWQAKESEKPLKPNLTTLTRENNLISVDALIEGLDQDLFKKLIIVEGDLAPLFEKDSQSIALILPLDDYGNSLKPNFYPAVGSKQTITYIEKDCFIDRRTGKKANENTPEDFIKYDITQSHDITYNICAYVTIPYSMSYRYSIPDSYTFVLPKDKLSSDSRQEVAPLFYLFDTPNLNAEKKAEQYLSELTKGNISKLMYESKATLRKEFKAFQRMFLLLGSILCSIIGLIGILNFFNATMMGILSRKQEFAILQAIGMTNKQLKTMLIYEGIFYALSSSLLALLLSFSVTPLICNFLEKIFWFFSSKVTILPVIITLPIFILLGCLIPYCLYRYTRKQSVIEKLRNIQ